jgi:hypothetical protein
MFFLQLPWLQLVKKIQLPVYNFCTMVDSSHAVFIGAIEFWQGDSTVTTVCVNVPSGP